ncbi:glutathione S-transferase family protein [Tropicibacter sp. Alg240-R139]|uniref:glutathione S-transferase family protein n=1 Tax=Tropicibacter sp. Alg240-R139 TaxID=2305991 RepID=UPI0013DEF5EE|nr:glutathione S-transferase family protein [Tropicibacter sp. Alg240-R139]
MIKIVSFKICPFVQRVTAMLDARNIPYHVDYISLSDKPHWFLDISPTGQVPVLITEDGEPIFESDAIAEYIDEIAPALEADLTPVARARNRAWGYQASKHYLVQCSAMRSADKETLAERSANLSRAFARAEGELGEGPFFNGKTLGNVDLAWLPLLDRARIITKYTGHDFLSDFPKVKAWQQSLDQTGLPAKSVAADFEQAFSEFYLSDQTYLGTGKCQAPRRGSGTCC